MIFGTISANTINSAATHAVAMLMTFSWLPNAAMANAVTKAVASALITVLAIRISDSSLSVRSSNQRMVMARLLPCLAKCRRRCRLAAITAVSVMEKKAEQRIRRD